MNQKSATPTDLQSLLGEDRPPRWWRRSSLWIGLVTLLLVAGGLVYWQAQSSQQGRARLPDAPSCASGDLTLTVTANGTLQPTRSVAVSAASSRAPSNACWWMSTTACGARCWWNWTHAKPARPGHPFARRAGRRRGALRRRRPPPAEARATLARLRDVARAVRRPGALGHRARQRARPRWRAPRPRSPAPRPTWRRPRHAVHRRDQPVQGHRSARPSTASCWRARWSRATRSRPRCRR
jgi:hypothetical protein